ncbi:protein translocase subunit SecD [Cellulomonas alba]|uniref:Protein translocase subunit SecD n=1 Tax=Cellulomonas alba TaxID=3053467 RepID=A0ABT7SD39_9CELL|nr:protein translocase subunit SecD [Cellulomonas alba]MDM7853439.1 protein translocase subunit SecD [Cellulomonas alba]
MAPPTRRSRPWRTLAALGVLIAIIYGVLAVGVATGKASWTPKLALDLEGGTQIILTPKATDATTGKITSNTINQAIDVIRQRIDASGVAEAQISAQGSNNIVVALPGHPSEATLDLVRTSAQMQMRPVLLEAGPAVSTEPTPSATDAATPAATPTPTPEATASQKYAKAADPTPAPTATAPAAPSSPSDASYYLTPEVQQQFEKLDCTDVKNRGGGDMGDPDKAFVTCDQQGQAKYVLGPVEIEGKDVKSAASGLNTLPGGGTGSDWVVDVTFNSKGAKQFADITERLKSQTSPLNQFAFVLDGNVISAPSVSVIIPDGRAQISGSFTRDSAATLANQLNFGSLPIQFQVQSEEQISATLGTDQLQKGLIAGAIGLVLVVLYSMLQYRALSSLTVGSLVVASILTYGVITILSWIQGYRLSLAGVAGLIVAIGITADSFIVYFERIRDELREGRTLPASVDRGWERARRTILASDTVNLIAAVVLYFLAVGSVRGFAFTLGLTTVIDVVVVFLFTHPVMQLLSGTRYFGGGHRWSGLDPRRLGVTTARYAGRGRVVTAASTAPAATEVAADEPAPAREPVPVGTPGMTIAERRAAAKAAAAKATADEPQQSEPEAGRTDGSEH